ncbi:AI-2E family transporter [Bombilactobacillus mellis]|uniref:AI-2E family transporter n=1 Tax=Bombilactobacillus mellis TaxID=1218508 RepID=UPI001580CBEA|nr:AI-2E family transporter [Bombilactobacillus mellis]MBI0106858.1 AI-2E family transporter [Lactobacillus sp. W8086]MBI0108322.1 AI-2E family transporter [Lactobacillus sp. W8085]MBI0111540.1 AI-2E family transporter [Lactobacillus sp. W8088]MBI0115255.1 AI-2E family transporter [Lactobacillus sp. W8087]MBI0118980.1 AI-2E family transporter [Lactobacillus sp. W8089]MBI0130945.1 AI-2E family transporter [Lactobacillus sp. W8090]
MKIYQAFIKNVPLRRICVLLACILMIWLLRAMMSTVLLTFIFTFLSVNFIRLIQRHWSLSPFWIITPVYVIIIGLIYLLATHYIPNIIDSTVGLIKKVFDFYDSNKSQNDPLIALLVESVKNFKLDEQIKTGLTEVWRYVTNLGAIGFTIVISFLLSYFYSFEVDWMNDFGRSFENSKLNWLFQDIHFFARKFVNTFGVVLEAQVIIAVINTLLTAIALTILKFPSVPSLAIMVFFLSMIPVAGVIISLIPLSIIGYTVGGLQTMVYVWIAILAIHALETYVLNPKLMSSRTHLPIFVTFVVLLVSEQLLGTWGLVVGIPIFTFFLDVLGVQTLNK